MMKITTLLKTKLTALACFCLMMFGGTTSAQVFQESFDAGVPPTGWVSLDNGLGTGVNWASSTTAFAGSGAASIDYDCSASGTEDWMITPQIAIPAGTSTLSFYQKDAFTVDYLSVFTVRVSTAALQNDTASFTTIETILETDMTTTYGIKTVDLSAYAGQNIYIAFVSLQDCGDEWFIDEMNIGAPPCLIPSALTVSNLGLNSADLGWTNGSGSIHEVELLPAGAPQTGAGMLTTTSAYAATGLSMATSYDFYVRSVCEGGAPMIISAIYDGPLPGGHPKGVELYIQDSISDLSRYALGSANNGTGSTAPNGEFTFPAGTASAGSFIYVTSDTAAFNTYFGFSAGYQSSAMLINGDDAVEVLRDSVVIDVFGDVNTDGSGETWEFLDGWAYRHNGIAANLGTFVDSNWTYSGTNVLDGCTSNGSCGSMIPFGTYVGSFNASTWVGPMTLTTLCGPAFAPYFESFDSVNTTPLCWTEGGANPFIYSTAADYAASAAGDHTGNNGQYMWQDASLNDDGDTSWILTPMIDLTAMTNPEVSYYLFSHNVDDTIFNELKIELWDGAAWNLLDSIKGDIGAAWVYKNYALSAFTITGNIQVRFMFVGEFGFSFFNDVLVDDFRVDDIPTCPQPDSMMVFATDTSATLSWNSNASGSEWIVWVTPTGSGPMGPGDTTSSNPYIWNGLNPATGYEFWVQEICSVGDSSIISGPLVFQTDCPTVLMGDSAAIAIPVTANPYLTTGNSSICFTDVIGQVSPDVWYTVVVDTWADSMLVSLCGSTFDTYLHVYDTGLNLVDENDDNGPDCSGLQSSLKIAVTPGDTLYVVVEGYSIAGDYTLSIEQDVTAPDPTISLPVNQFCVDSMTVMPVINGDSGGVFTATNGLVLDSLTGAFTVDVAGSYDIIYTVGDSICTASDTVSVTIMALANATFSYSADTLCNTDSLGLVDSMMTAGGVFTSSTGAVVDSTTGTIDLSTTTLGAHSITYTVGGMCPGTMTVDVVIIDCINSIFGGFDVSSQYGLYPNPNNGNFKIVNHGNDTEVNIMVMDITGKIVHNQEAFLVNGENHAIRLMEVTAGTYFVRILDGNKIATFKISVEQN